MNFVKTNLYLIISGVVVLLAIGCYFWPIGAWKEALQADMNARISKVSEAKTLATGSIEIFPGGKKIVGPIQPNVIEARNQAQAYMKDQASRIAGQAADQNQANRAVRKGARVLPLLGGKELPGYLPEFAQGTDAHDYKDWYLKVTSNWPVLLAGTDQVAAAPTGTEVGAALDADLRARSATPTVGRGGPTSDFMSGAGLDTKKKVDFTRDFVSKRAASIRMYVTADSFDREAWAGGTGAPNETQIFESLVKCWLQQDVVNAIDAVNRDGQKNPNKDVGQSGIKRLEWIKVGVDATGGGLFQTGSGGGGAAARGLGGGAGAAATAEPSRSMTGRVSTNDYDVVVMTVSMVVDPAKLNAFIDQLYRQNNAYTVLNVKQTTVDPFQAVSEGYLYGETQCIHVEVQVEALLFRKWTSPLMPESIRTQLGVPAVASK
jgi:hypothetical protein